MSNGTRCYCGSCRIRSLQGPLILITIGVLFALDHIWGWWRFGDTWPVLLIVMGLVQLASRLTPVDGHQPRPQPPSTETMPPDPFGEAPHAS
jgi:hypothetical protein